MSVKGFIYPRTASGKASFLPDPPWHYSGEMLTMEYRTDPERVAELLPDGIELADEDPGAVSIIWADWQNCRDNYEEILDPARSQYRELFVVIRCKYQGKTYSRCAYIWVDKDWAMVRGHFQGYPKKMGSIHMSRPINVGQAGPRLEVGGKFGASLAAYDHKLLHGNFTITDTCDHAGFVNSHPMLHNRIMPAIENDGTDSLNELCTMSAYQGEVGRSFTGDFELNIFESPMEELHRLPLREKIAGYYREVSFSWKSGTTIERHNLPDLPKQ